MRVSLIDDRLEYSGFFKLRRFTIEHELYNGDMSAPLVREVLSRSDVVAAVLLDSTLDKIVMIEQFRAGVYAAGLHPWLIDIVAGRIEDDQSPMDAIIREVVEESGLSPFSVEPIGIYLTAPHLSSERVHLFCAQVDSSRVSGTHGVAAEGEDVRPVVMDRREALGLARTQPLSLWAGLALAWISGDGSR